MQIDYPVNQEVYPMFIDKYDLKITAFFNTKELEQAVCDLSPCRVEKFEKALKNIDYDKIITFLGNPIVFITPSIEGVVYWRKVIFENQIFSYTIAFLFPLLVAANKKNASKINYRVDIYFRGVSHTEIRENIQSLIDRIAEELNKENSA